MKSIVEIIVDKSGSMGYMNGSKDHENKYLLPDGSTRMSLAKKILSQDIIPIIDYASLIVIRTFRVSRNGKQDFNDVEKIYDGEYDKDRVTRIISALDNPPPGGSPISAAIEMAITNLKSFSNYDRKIILITDGEENGGGDYKKTIEEAETIHGVPCGVFIVGIDQDDSAEQKSKKITQATGGKYLNLKTNNYETSSVSSVLSGFKSSILASSVENLTKSVEVSSDLNTAIEDVNSETTRIVIQEQEEEKKEQINLEANGDKETIQNIKEASISEVVNNNSQSINIISKQLSIISDEIKQIRSFDNLPDSEEFYENKELNEKTRVNSETFVYDMLKKMYQDRVVWFNKDGESHSACDFQILKPDKSIEYYIDCKASKNNTNQFLMTENEWDLFLNNTKNYQIYFVSNALTNPELLIVDNLLDWILSGRVVPFSSKKICLKAGRILLTINEK
ncbi:protein NO VEIN domain-containing protein [Carboxylicivirga sp. N1Y90]|uniref:protein NO VEIN domain-containing protein n=1 Tax=Carboxylicivirga fragile TaxID=3417571 RepID=UPI003D33868E|nr:DUF3883 domain-containing protein [Marinilabiliaceae bacterium N1Y90]